MIRTVIVVMATTLLATAALAQTACETSGSWQG